MAYCLLLIYIALNVGIFIQYIIKVNGVFQLPFLFAVVSLTFVTPQLVAIYNNIIDPDTFMISALIMMILCNCAFFMAFAMASSSKRKYRVVVDAERSKILVLLFFFIGAIAYFKNRGVYKGGTIEGVYVIVNFFTSFISYSYVLILVLWNRVKNRRTKILFKIIGFCAACIIFDKVLQGGRRQEAILLVLTTGYFFYTKMSAIFKNIFKWAIPIFFIIGALGQTKIDDYRNEMYEGANAKTAIKQLDFSNAWEDIFSVDNGEIYYCMEGINNVETYSFGTEHYDRIIGDFLPSVLVGHDIKNSIMFNRMEYPIGIPTGMTTTGYYDSFVSFGYFGFIIFVFIGYLLGYLWKNRAYSDVYLIFYFALISIDLHLLTHSTTYFTSSAFFFCVFVYPFIRRISRVTKIKA